MENREILFRGINANNEFVYGLPYTDSKGETVYYDEYSNRMCWRNENAIHCNQPYKNGSLEQFTGVLDKNGKKVFEGDKVIPYFENDNGHIPEYFWVVKYRDCYFYMESTNRTPNVIETMFDFSNVIVIGTIHDHLLESNNE